MTILNKYVYLFQFKGNFLFHYLCIRQLKQTYYQVSNNLLFVTTQKLHSLIRCISWKYVARTSELDQSQWFNVLLQQDLHRVKGVSNVFCLARAKNNLFFLRKLTLTACSKDEFTCNYESCLELYKRCDGKEDWKDGSDEEGWKTIKVFDGYNKFNVPPPIGKENKLIMNISISNITYMVQSSTQISKSENKWRE